MAEIGRDSEPSAGSSKARPRVRWVTRLVRLALLFVLLVIVTAPATSSREHGAVGVSRPAAAGGHVLKYAVIALITGAMIYPLVRGRAQKDWGVFRRIRPSMVVENLLVLVVVIAFAVVLKLCVPFLDRSWLYRLPLAGGQAVNVILLPTAVRFLPLIYIPLLVLNLPALAAGEEESFREGTKDWGHAVVRSIRFGLVHCWVGIPIYAGIALGIGGLWFTYQYFRGGVEQSTVHHLTYNLVIVTLLAVAVAMRGAL